MSQKPSLRKQVRQHSHWPNVLLLLNNSSAEVQWCVQAFTTCTLKDLCPEDKQKVAQLVKQVREHVRQHDCASPQLRPTAQYHALHQNTPLFLWPAGGGAGEGKPAAKSGSCNGEYTAGLCSSSAPVASLSSIHTSAMCRLPCECCRTCCCRLWQLRKSCGKYRSATSRQ
jgi:hypothetical protein